MIKIFFYQKFESLLWSIKKTSLARVTKTQSYFDNILLIQHFAHFNLGNHLAILEFSK